MTCAISLIVANEDFVSNSGWWKAIRGTIVRVI